MDDKSYIDLIELLKEKIKHEEEIYHQALKEDKEFWELKEIRNKIRLLQSTLEKLQDRSKEQAI